VSGPLVANAPLSYGAFEATVGTDVLIPDPEEVLDAIALAGYAGTDLGPPGYLGEGAGLRRRLRDHGLEVVGGFVPIRSASRPTGTRTSEACTTPWTSSTRRARPAPGPCSPTRASPGRLANPGGGAQDASLRPGRTGWSALGRRRGPGGGRGPRPGLRAGASTITPRAYVEAVPRSSASWRTRRRSSCSTAGHLAVAGGDPVEGLRAWRDRVGAVHLKDARTDVLQAVRAERAGMLDAWRRGLFCALGEGDVALEAFCAELEAMGYDGWVVVEQDRVLDDAGAFARARAEQERNRTWLREHVGW
jgi:inosose dehydratase